MAEGQTHQGIIIAKRRASDAAVVVNLLALLNSATTDELINQIRYIWLTLSLARLVAVTTAHSRLGHIEEMLLAPARYFHLLHQAQHAPHDSRLQHQVGAAVGALNAGHRAGRTQAKAPRQGIRCAPDEAALLTTGAPMKVLVVVLTLLTGRRTHDQTRVT